MLNEIAVVGFMIGVFLWMRRHPEDLKVLSLRSWWNGAKKLTWSQWGNWAWLTVAFTVLLYFAVPYLAVRAVELTKVPLIDPSAYIPAQLASRLILWVMIPLLPVIAVSEEWIFRDIIQRRLGARYKFVGLVIGAFLFAGYHLISGGMLWPALLPTLGGGLIFGAAYQVGGLKLAVTSHLMYDYLALASMF